MPSAKQKAQRSRFKLKGFIQSTLNQIAKIQEEGGLHYSEPMSLKKIKVSCNAKMH